MTSQFISKLVNELNGTDFWKLRRSYSPAVCINSFQNQWKFNCCSYVRYFKFSDQVQEYVEAATFFRFCKAGTLMNLDEINANLASLNLPFAEPLRINILDYLLGVSFLLSVGN